MKNSAVSIVFLFTTILVLPAQAQQPPLSPASAPDDRPPNIIVLMVDDLDSLSLDTLIARGRMPNLREFVIDPGISFSESYVTNAVCCPSRATYLSGQYSHNHSVYSNVAENGSVLAFDETNTLVTWLSEADYRTGHVGKYLNFYGYLGMFLEDPVQMEEVRQSLQVAFGEASEKLEPSYVPPGWSDWYGLIDTSTYCEYDYRMHARPMGLESQMLLFNQDGSITDLQSAETISEGVVPDNYQTDVLAEYARQFIEDADRQDDAQPFFLSLTPLAPHVEACDPLVSTVVEASQKNDNIAQALKQTDPETSAQESYKELFAENIRPAERHMSQLALLESIAAEYLPLIPSFNEADLTDKPVEAQDQLELLDPTDVSNVSSQFAGRLASMLAVDDMIGTIVQELQTRDEWDHTVLIFTSDNGWFYGQHRLSSKGRAYSEAIRVPLYVRFPPLFSIAAGATIDEIVLNNDLAPTIAELAGAQAPTHTIDGRSIMPLVMDPTLPNWRTRFLIEHFTSKYDSDPGPVFETHNLFGVQTSASDATPLSLYVENFPGVQKRTGYYLDPEQTTSTGSFVWEQLPCSKELYNMERDPYQLQNRLAVERPTRKKAILKQYLSELIVCQGDSCRSAEDE